MSETIPAKQTEELAPSVKDDFYRSVNHQWLTEHEIPEDRPNYATFTILRDLSQENLRAIVEEADQNAVEPGESNQGESNAAPDPLDAQLGGMYRSFMDRERVNKLGLEPIKADIDQINSLTTVPELLERSAELAAAGKATLLGLEVEADFQDTEAYRLYLDQALIGLPDREYYFDERFEQARAGYRSYLQSVFTALGVANPQEQAQLLFDFETRIAQTHMDKVTRRNPQAIYNPTSREELDQQVPWLGSWLQRVGVPAEHLETVVVNSPEYVQSLKSVVSEDNLEALKLSLLAQLFRSRAAYLSDPLVKINFDFYSHTLSGVPEQRPLWKRGVDLVENTLSDALGQRYVERHFGVEAKRRMDELVAALLDAYRTSLSELEWMSQSTRTAALEKLDKFTPKIGYPSSWDDYSGLVVDPQDLIGNVNRSAQLEFRRAVDRLGTTVDKDRWYMSPQTVNAYYHPLHNEIAFPAAILQPPFFSLEASDAQNFAAIGAVIGHEIGHGFDDQGSQFDGDGSLRNWWGESDRANFEERTAALVAQFETLSPEGVSDQLVNGKLTLGENIGDLGGLTIALKAWKSTLPTGQEVDLAKLQEFFRSYATIWRAKTRPEHAALALSIDPHAPAEFRANQIVKNVDEFYDAFDIAEGDGMWLAPEERVKIWF